MKMKITLIFQNKTSISFIKIYMGGSVVEYYTYYIGSYPEFSEEFHFFNVGTSPVTIIIF